MERFVQHMVPNLRELFIIALISGFLAGVIFFSEPARAQVASGKVYGIDITPTGDAAEIQVSDPSIDYVVFRTSVDGNGSARPITIEIDGPPLSALTEVSGGLGDPWYVDFLDRGRKTKVLDISKSDRNSVKVKLLLEEFPGLTISEITQFFGLTLSKILDQLFPDDEPLPEGVKIRGLLRTNSCAPSRLLTLKLIANMQSLRDSTVQDGVALIGGIDVEFPSSKGVRRFGRPLTVMEKGKAYVQLPIVSQKETKLQVVQWIDGIPQEPKLVRARRFITRGKRVFAIVEKTQLPRGATLERYTRDLSDILSACILK